MRISSCVIAAGVLALAGCGESRQSGDAKEDSPAKTATAGAAEMRLEPGQWETTVETLGMEAPGLPPQAQAAMGAGRKVTVSNCVTPEQANKPNADLFAAKQDANCSQKGFSMEGGRIRGSMTCSGGDMPGTMKMEMDGTYAPTNYDIAQTMTTSGEGMEMRIKSRVTGRRTGECSQGG